MLVFYLEIKFFFKFIYNGNNVICFENNIVNCCLRYFNNVILFFGRGFGNCGEE